jgi:hypothetical protein
MGDMKTLGPAVSGIPLDTVALRAIENSELERLIPRFYNRAELGVEQFLGANIELSKNAEASFTLPEVVEVWFESYTGAEPALSFPDFVKGVGCAAQAVNPADIGMVKAMVRELSTRVAQGAGLPTLDEAFVDQVRGCFEAILSNGEPISWRGLMAFTVGAFWLLGFIGPSHPKRGMQSPLAFVEGFVRQYAALGYLPA